MNLVENCNQITITINNIYELYKSCVVTEYGSEIKKTEYKLDSC